MLDTLVVTQKVRLKKDHARDSKEGSHSGLENRIALGTLKRDHTWDSKTHVPTQGSKKESHSGL